MALSRHDARSHIPQSVQDISKEAENFEFSTQRSLQAWLRSAQMLNTEAAMYEIDGDIHMAYLYLYRHAQLVYEKLPTHPGFRDVAYRRDVQAAQKAVKNNLTKLEEWKPMLNHRYEEHVEAMNRRRAERELPRNDGRHDSTRQANFSNDRHSFDGEDQRSIKPNEYKEVAIDIARRELRRRRGDSHIEPMEHKPSNRQKERRGSRHLETNDANHVSSSIQHTASLLGRERDDRYFNRARDPPKTTTRSYYYPAVPERESTMHWETARPQPLSTTEAPRLPSKELLSSTHPAQSIPALPPKQQDQPNSPSSPPSQYTFKSIARTESGSPLRTLFLPSSLRTDFLNLAHPNTARNLETCGILCGTSVRGALFITHLIVPDQTATSDTCDTTDTGDTVLFDFCDAHALLVCGWIHTHPSQSCFLSSRDLHTSAGYQVMLPEAIAIVCAPRHNPDWGMFRLTNPPGLGAVLDCTTPGLFHPHSETNLYTDALRPGHVVEGNEMDFELVDLRKT